MSFVHVSAACATGSLLSFSSCLSLRNFQSDIPFDDLTKSIVTVLQGSLSEP